VYFLLLDRKLRNPATEDEIDKRNRNSLGMSTLIIGGKINIKRKICLLSTETRRIMVLGLKNFKRMAILFNDPSKPGACWSARR